MRRGASRLVPASALRKAILDAFYEGWLRRPGPNDYFPITQVWEGVLRSHGERVDRPLFEGAFNSLLSEECLHAVEASEGTVAARITDKGRSYREDLIKNERTKVLAYIGAFTGTAALLWNVASKLLLP